MYVFFSAFDCDVDYIALTFFASIYDQRAVLLRSLDLGETGEVDFSEFESVFGNAP